MIVFDLECRSGGHRFEGWFGSTDDFARQQERGLVTCPVCDAADVVKAVTAPNLARKGNQSPAIAPHRDNAQSAPAPAPAPASTSASQPVLASAMPPEAQAMFRALAAMQAEALKSSRWVGDNFAEKARAMHYGENEVEAIHGQTTPDEAIELFEEGIDIAPILFPLAPPGETN
ncbi:DUF1178 family protein [Novosphingobium lentum]|uniref:DUF1178 family protein n=1 Tax=Novosphingobium lentum TaxID=145287 RepID=UPI00082D9DB7|nr:DUF1178 family protein [Novosphingobium lentum]